MKKRDMRFQAAVAAMQAIISKSPLFDLYGNVGNGEEADKEMMESVMTAIADGAVRYADALLDELESDKAANNGD